MQVSNPNNVKIYNLSAGKSLPEWLSARKRRTLLKKDRDLRHSVELIQNFEMPVVSTGVKMCRDGNHIMTTGIYKPRVRCFDVNNLSMKFERCFDSEVVTFEILSDDYTKMVFLQCDRYVELHASYGKYYRLRIPKFGRDMKYHPPSCDLYLVGASNQIYRLNLELGRFLQPLQSDSSSFFNSCAFNPFHYLFVCGSAEGKVESWDPRMPVRVGVLDCGLSSILEEADLKSLPSVTALEFCDALTLGVGLGSGLILLYDIRSSKPLLVKDHMYDLPIKGVKFHKSMDLVLSMDARTLKMWDKNTGKHFTSIESESELNELCLVPDTGLMFMANESKKLHTFYIPSLGPAPKWCSFLDNITEELEENSGEAVVYDDYKFITQTELNDLGMSHLLGTNLLRSYMHGYFMDIRLYRKAKSISEPFVFEEYKRKKIREMIEKERENRVQLRKLPKVNQELALKLIDSQQRFDERKSQGKRVKKKIGPNLLDDNRFKALFDDPNFEVDKEADEYRLLAPVISHLDKDRMTELRKQMSKQEVVRHSVTDLQADDGSRENGDSSSGEDVIIESDDSESDGGGSSSDDDRLAKREMISEMKTQYQFVKRKDEMRKRQEDLEARLNPPLPAAIPERQMKVFEMKPGDELKGIRSVQGSQRIARASFAERLERESDGSPALPGSRKFNNIGNKEFEFKLKSKRKSYDGNRDEKSSESNSAAAGGRSSASSSSNRTGVRSARGLSSGKKAPGRKFWMGKLT